MKVYLVIEFLKIVLGLKKKTLERFIFNSRKQRGNKTFDNFKTDFFKIVRNCEYDMQEDSILRDRIVPCS